MGLSQEQDDQLLQKWKNVLLLYLQVKPYVIASEKAAASLGEGLGGDGRERLSVTAINELRNAFDHFARAQAVWQGWVPVPEKAGLGAFEYCLTNIDKAKGHVYRAGYDALDIITTAKAAEVQRIVSSLRPSTLVTVFPTYGAEIRQPLMNALRFCDEAKASKDVESDKMGQQYYQMYKDALALLDGALTKLVAGLPELAAVDAEKRQDYRLQRNIAVALAVVGIVATLVVGILWGKW
jgi:hypothetical protein